MACIIKIPSENSKGVVSFTTQERDRFIVPDKNITEKVMQLKDKWLIGLHHNWHDYNFNYNPLFDFSMAGEEDLIEKNGKNFSLLPMDACNFVPECFKPTNTEKFWDILYVARAVKFKKIPEFLECVRSMYDHGKKYRILFICPIPPYKKEEEKTVFYEIREVYDKMFSEEEKDLFTLLTIDYRHPFPFDLPTLGHFYNSSKIFVHFADNERRCRVAAYAWRSGLPVVGMSCVGSLAPKKLRKEPYFYEVKNYKNFEEKINDALKNLDDKPINSEISQYFDEKNAIGIFDTYLKKIFESKNFPYETNLLFKNNLDIRLGRHHLGQKGLNSLALTFEQFVDTIKSEAKWDTILKQNDPERYFDNLNEKGHNFMSKIIKYIK